MDPITGDEFDLIRIIRAAQAPAPDSVLLGIGDDGALLATRAGQSLVAVTDTLVAGRHFPDDTDPFSLGWKALAVNLSDLAAMAAEPRWVLLALTLPDPDPRWVHRFAEGLAALARMAGVALVGGDTTRGPLSVTVTALGEVRVEYALRRDGARPGDRVCVAGVIGEAALGLIAVQAGKRDDHRFAHCIARLDRPDPELRVANLLRGRASACIDVSDGLLADLSHVAAASGVAIELDALALPRPAGELAEALGLDVDQALESAWCGGDDYRLAFTLPFEAIDEVRRDLSAQGLDLYEIGSVVAGAGVRLNREGRPLNPLRPGFNHFELAHD